MFAARGRGHLWFAWVAQQYGDQRPFPYVRITTVRESGLVAAFGGGAGERDYFPGAMIAAFDDVTPVSPTIDYFLPGKGNACVETPNTNHGRWGDYLTIRGWNGRSGLWLATAFSREDDTPVGCDETVPMTIKNVVFGRERDRRAYERGIAAG